MNTTPHYCLTFFTSAPPGRKYQNATVKFVTFSEGNTELYKGDSCVMFLLIIYYGIAQVNLLMQKQG